MSRSLAAVSFTLLCLIPLNLLAQRSPTVPSVFALSVPGLNATFKSCSGLASATDVTEFRQGGDTGTTIVRKIAGLTKFSNITLKRGVTTDQSLATWRRMVEDGQVDQARRNGFIILYDMSNKEVARWSLASAWPSALAIETDSDTGGVMEVLTLAVDVVHRQ